MKGYRKLRIKPSAAELAARRKKREEAARAWVEMLAPHSSAADGPALAILPAPVGPKDATQP